MSTTIDGSASVTINSGAILGITSGTAVASTSGTSIDFTSIPSWVKRVTVMFNLVSTNGTSPFLIQIGSGSITSTGYISGGTSLIPASAIQYATSTAGFVCSNTNSAGGTVQGAYRISLLSGNIYVADGNAHNTNGASMNCMAGGVTLSGVLDRVRITTVGGTDTFDAGTINILYEG